MDIAAINECVDSFSTNLHKWGLVQFDCSPLHVKDRGAVSDDCVIFKLSLLIKILTCLAAVARSYRDARVP